MRIVSSFRDYYDCMQAYGQDQTTLYVRETKKVKLRSNCSRQPFTIDNTIVASNIIGFCGKVYKCLCLSPYYKNESFFLYNTEDVDKYIREHGSDKLNERYFGKSGSGRSRSYWRYWGDITRVATEKYFEKQGQAEPYFEKFFIEYRCPVWVIRDIYSRWNSEETLVINDRLNQYNFFRVFDAPSAFQEITMYFGSVLAAPEKPIPDVSDEDMAEIKGFNKWSFRKPPSGKKKR